MGIERVSTFSLWTLRESIN